jgi:two-component system response regulator NreC
VADPDAAAGPAAIPGGPAAAGGATLDVLLAIVDFPILLAGYRAVIDAAPDLRVAGVVDCSEAIREAVARSNADVVVTGCLADSSGRSGAPGAIEEIRAARPTARILVLDCGAGTAPYHDAARAGADGFLTRGASAVEVLAAVRCIGRGAAPVMATVFARTPGTDGLERPSAVPDGAFDSLSEQARAVFHLAAMGRSSREIATTLDISERAVRNLRATIMESLGTHGRVDLLRYALRRGIIAATDL